MDCTPSTRREQEAARRRRDKDAEPSSHASVASPRPCCGRRVTSKAARRRRVGASVTMILIPTFSFFYLPCLTTIIHIQPYFFSIGV